MQYIKHTSDDLKPGHRTFCLQRNDDRIDFLAYLGGQSSSLANCFVGRMFLHNGFYKALRVQPDILRPIYINRDGSRTIPPSPQSAVELVLRDSLGIKGFKFTPEASKEQKQQAFRELIDIFVETSQNQDFQSEKNLFGVQSNNYSVLYNNGGPADVKITSEDIQEKLMMNCPPPRSRGNQFEL